MDEVKDAPDDVTGDFDASALVVRGARFERLGDFRILREAGRGGMGVVYEALQESLGRRVALKVLAAHAIPDPVQLRRFEREARAAAHLHHTNIVPVFGVGEQDGLHYYVMQFIEGMGLDHLIDQVKLLRVARPVRLPATGPSAELGKPGESADLAATAIARSLMTEHFAASAPEADARSSIDFARPDELAMETHSPRSTVESPDGCAEQTSIAPELSAVRASDAGYWRSVARVGLQVAQCSSTPTPRASSIAISSPRISCLTAQGTAWVADFGLAKAVEGDNITHTGDIVGTIRYMAPERFRGECDARSDVYALGLTLYEMAALRPAFDQTARQTLIRQVMEEEPARSAQNCSRRAARPGDDHSESDGTRPRRSLPDGRVLAEDLSFFLDDRPIRARDISALERCWKWARRRPAIAALLAGLFLTVSTALVAVTWQWRNAVTARDEARKTLKLATEAVNTYYKEVSEQHLLNEPGMQPLRERLLKLALPYYQSFAAQGSADPSLQVDLANAYLRWGTITGEIGSKVEALKIIRTAIVQFERLSQSDSRNLDVQTGLARSNQLLAQELIVMNLGELGDSGAEPARCAATAWERVVRFQAGAPEPRRMLGRSYDLLAIAERRSGTIAEKKQRFQKAVEVLAAAFRDFPDDEATLRHLALANNNLGCFCRTEGDWAGGETALGQSRDLLRRLLAEEPTSSTYMTDLSRTLLNLGEIRLRTGSLRESESALTEGLAIINQLIQANPQVTAHRYLHSLFVDALGFVFVEQGRTTSARRMFREKIAELERLREPGGDMSAINIDVAGAWTGIASVEWQLGHRPAATEACGTAEVLLGAITEEKLDLNEQAVFFDLRRISIQCGGRPAEEPVSQIARLLTLVRTKADALSANPLDSMSRSQVVSVYLLVGQLRARSGANTEATHDFRMAAEFLCKGSN